MWFPFITSMVTSGRSRSRRPRPARRRLTVGLLETRLTPSLSTLASFTGTNGAEPLCALIMDSSGNLYGTSEYGGASNDGTVFELAHGSGTITTLASFNGSNGSRPFAGLIMDSSGNLYGTTAGGGASNDGTIFELAHGSGTITTLASFNGTNGDGPEAGLIMDSSGNLYGTTFYGGASWGSGGVGNSLGYGTVFELQAGSSAITTLASFNGTDGYSPEAGLIMDSSGNLYGTTGGGGASGYGTIFELAHGSGTITTLASFNGHNGEDPVAPLVMDSSGNLYGTTYYGGPTWVAGSNLSPGTGTIFELAHGSSTITTLASFPVDAGDITPNGACPEGALVMDSSGNLYGTAHSGGPEYPPGYGTIFKLAHGSGAITTLASFDRTDGSGPQGGLIMDSSGNLYGTTSAGGTKNDGTIFELTGAATAAVQGSAASFVVSAGQPMGAAGVLHLAVVQRTHGGFEPVEGATQDMAGNKDTILTAEQVQTSAGGEELVPAFREIDLLFARQSPAGGEDLVLVPGDIDLLFAGHWNESLGLRHDNARG